jgi:hypothetical protein
MNRKEKFNQLEIVKRALIKAGLIDKVQIGLYLMENYVGKRTLHIKCTWEETYKGAFIGIGDRPFYTKTTEKIEEINGYFSGRVFAQGIVQRKDWLLASEADRQAYLESDRYAHPAMYRA